MRHCRGRLVGEARYLNQTLGSGKHKPGGENLEDLKCRKEDEMIKITPHPFSEEAFKKDGYVRFHTGLPNFKVLKAKYNHMVSAVPTSKYNKLKPFEEFIAVLMKIRLNCQMQDLAYRFKVSISTTSQIFLKWITVMDGRLRHLIVWPDRECLIKNYANLVPEFFWEESSCCC